MGEHALVGITMAVEVAGHLQHRTVRSEFDVGLVHRLSSQQLQVHVVKLVETFIPQGVEDGKRRVGAGIY